MKNFIVYLTESHRIALKVKIDFDKCKFIKVQALDIFTAVHIAKDIQKIQHLPYNIEPENVTPIFTEMKGWKADLTGMTSYDELPQELKTYIEFIEKEVEVPIKVISVGPDRKQTIMK